MQHKRIELYSAKEERWPSIAAEEKGRQGEKGRATLRLVSRLIWQSLRQKGWRQGRGIFLYYLRFLSVVFLIVMARDGEGACLRPVFS